MSELPRLKDEDDLAGALLRSAEDDGPSPHTRAAIASAIGVSAAIGAGSAHAAGSAAKTTLAGKLATSVIVKVTAAVMIVGTTVGVYRVTRAPVHQPSPVVEPRAATPAEPTAPAEPPPIIATRPPAPIAAPTPTVAPALAPPASPIARVPVRVVPSPLGAPRDEAEPPAPAAEPAEPPAPPSEPPPSLADEVALLDAAVSKLHHRDAPGAVALLDEYAQRFPSGRLAPEATAARIEALVALGDRATAHALAAKFLAEHADSPLAPRVRDLVATHPR